MMRRVLVAILAVVSLASTAGAQRPVHVRGYFRADGTWVAPHYRSAPNGTTLDNWSTRGNINPFTGERGTRRASEWVIAPPGVPPQSQSQPPRPLASEPVGLQYVHSDYILFRVEPHEDAPGYSFVIRGDSVWVGGADSHGWAVVMYPDGRFGGFVNTITAWGLRSSPPPPRYTPTGEGVSGRWSVVYTSGDSVTVFHDPTRAHHIYEALYDVWVRWDFAWLQRTTDGVPWDRSILRTRVDCEALTVAAQNAYFYRGTTLVNEHVGSLAETVPLIPGSVGENVYEAICRQLGRAAGT